MKKITVSAVAAVCICLAISCQKDDGTQLKGGYPIFTATIDNSRTKTIIDTDPSSATAGKICWEMTDTIAVKDYSGNTAIYIVKSIDEGKAVFEYKSGDALGVGPYTATYGSEPLENQTYGAVAGNLPMSAASETSEFTFRTTCGLLKMTLRKAGESIKSITVTGTPEGGTETKYCLSCETAQSIESSKDFYIALPAGSYYRYVFRDSEGSACTKTAKEGQSTIIETNKIKPVTFSSSLSFVYKCTDLSSAGTANCYIVSEGGNYKFRTVKGNSDASVGDVKGVKVLWETFGTDEVPSVGDLIRPDVSCSDTYITFSTNDIYKEGNAVIAAFSDAGCTDGKVLWSWHIWLTDQPESQVYNNDAGTMMDRNLGATSAVPGDIHSLGLLYQWGRKDPFIGNRSVINESQYGTSAASTITWPRNSGSNATNGTIDYAVSHPTKFILNNSFNNDWYYTGSSDSDSTRWNPSSKTIYDPCPASWKVPAGGSGSIWSKAFGSDAGFKGSLDKTNRGMNFGSSNGKSLAQQLGKDENIWYPAAGCRSFSTSGLKWPGSKGYYWTSTSANADTTACSFFFDVTGDVVISSGRERSGGRSVRCILDHSVASIEIVKQ